MVGATISAGCYSDSWRRRPASVFTFTVPHAAKRAWLTPDHHFSMPILGAHQSIAGGYYKAVEAARSAAATACNFYEEQQPMACQGDLG